MSHGRVGGCLPQTGRGELYFDTCPGQLIGAPVVPSDSTELKLPRGMKYAGGGTVCDVCWLKP